MPYSKPSDAPDYVPASKKAQWVEVWNSVYDSAKKDGKSDKDAEAEAFKQATGVANKDSERCNEMKPEYRFTAELRAEGQGDEMALIGYAALFNTESKDLGGFKEVIAPGAFSRSLKEKADVKALINHDPNQLLGRTKNGTLVLDQDERGLKFRVQLNPASQMHRDIHASIKRGDMDECSFAFMVPANGDDWTEAGNRGNEDFYAMRTLKDVDLMDVSAVTYPAYNNTAVAARMLFPEGHPAEVRSALDRFAAKKALASKRDLGEDDSFEELICEVQQALNEKFPYPTTENGATVPNSWGKYWVIETHVTYVIVCDSTTQEYCKIEYNEDEVNETFTFGEPIAVEKEWVPTDERSVARLAEFRNKLKGIADEHASKAAAIASEAKAHADAAEAIAAKAAEQKAYREEYGLLEDEDYEENHFVDAEDAYDNDDDEIGETEEEDAYRTRHAAFIATLEKRAADGKVRTKRVGGKNLTKKAFAYVGDPQRTETWKLPIHDAAHVRNALARFGQTQGIPEEKKAGVYRKITAAAKKFGIHVSEEESGRALRGLPMDEVDIQAARVALANIAVTGKR